MKKTEKINFFLVFIIIGIAFGDLYGNLITPLARYNAETAFFAILLAGEILTAAIYLMLTRAKPKKLGYFVKYILLAVVTSNLAFWLYIAAERQW